MWKKKSRSSWTLQKPSLKGKASIIQDDGGYRISIKVEDREFGMVLKELEEFFQDKRKALNKIKKEMEEFADL